MLTSYYNGDKQTMHHKCDNQNKNKYITIISSRSVKWLVNATMLLFNVFVFYQVINCMSESMKSNLLYLKTAFTLLDKS